MGNELDVREVTDEIRRAWVVFHPVANEGVIWIIMQDGEIHFLKEEKE